MFASASNNIVAGDDSYSFMSDANGEIIILGIKENKGKDRFKTQGVKSIDKKTQDFWNTINGKKLIKILSAWNEQN